jgi:predicted nucleotidyltransferase
MDRAIKVPKQSLECTLCRLGSPTTVVSEDVLMNRQAILDRLNAEAPGLRTKYGVKSLAVFGSMARGDDHEGSDVDILVTFDGPATFDNFFDLKFYLEDALGRPIDLVTPKALRPEMRPRIERECIHVS